MKSKEYIKDFNHSLLHEQLEEGYVTFENMVGFGNNVKVAHYSITPLPDGVLISVEDDLDFPDDIVAFHDSTRESKSDIDKRLKAVMKRSTLDKLGITEEEFQSLL